MSRDQSPPVSTPYAAYRKRMRKALRTSLCDLADGLRPTESVSNAMASRKKLSDWAISSVSIMADIAAWPRPIE